MKHFVCTGDCAAEASKAGVCQTEGCDREGETLTECNCEDGIHDEINLAPNPTDEEQV